MTLTLLLQAILVAAVAYMAYDTYKAIRRK
jgi:hypothetical protein